MPNFSTLSRRQKTLQVNIPYRGSDGPLQRLIDSTGIKVEGEGEWTIYNNVSIDRALSGRTVARVIRAAATSVCDKDTAPSFMGHSRRVGGAQDLLKRGLDTAGIMRAGGWKSVHVLARYLEQADHNPWV